MSVKKCQAYVGIVFHCIYCYHPVVFFLCLLSPGQFPSTFVEEVTIPSTKPGDRLYVCINDFSSAEAGNLSLKRGTDILRALIRTMITIKVMVEE